ncbi:MAG: hypothetical protein ABSG71_20765 [Thermodesulfobacteriota bacterium]|jgi:hypothetical protein
MGSLKEHCEDCLRELGEPFEEVHKFLDQFFKSVGPDHHCKFLHNRKGIEEVRRRRGDRAALAARIHIKKDEEEGILIKE